ncbi:DUF551 domain-containing protein [Salmonella enterica subsp. enterica serovar Bukavu]|nr:DUF551 domain-containing protein [Salmonella enterica subsp. enterica serovar Bukavu]ECD3309929.1 DUF551 domain-containing protein [Salmonella enterica subsp. enterica serovar Bukavu]
MNPVSCKLLNEAWEKEFPDEVAIAERMLALLDELEHYKSREERVTKLVLDNSTSWDALYKKLEAAEKRIAELEAELVSQTYKLPELIEGMEMSIDVSTCDADAGNRYFGTVTEVSELDTAKNGYILLVQDAKPNFDVNGNSPVSPGGWISCSERMPDNDESKPIAIFTGKCLGQGMFVATYDDDGFFDYWEGMEIIGVTHWMPLPDPPQEVNRG